MRTSLSALVGAMLIGIAGHGRAAVAPMVPLEKPPAAAVADNAEMIAIFDADQADRKDMAKIDWSVVGPRDEVRKTRTLALVDAGKLKTGGDFFRAAFVFQHGSGPDDFLLAHTFALIAAARGRRDAPWIAAATLDRYLQTIGQKQIYGTQFRNENNGPITQEPYDRKLVSDALRAALGVPPLETQDRHRQEWDALLKGGSARP